MEGLNRSYWARNKGKVLFPALVGLSAIAFVMTTPTNGRGGMLTIFVILAFLCSPFTLKTGAGRLWWGGFATILGAGAAAVLLGPYNPLGWILAVAAAIAIGICVCLRWNMPKE